MSLDVMETETLSDEQIELLLQEAEGRLRAKAGAVVAPIQAENELTLRLDEDQPEFAKRKPIPRLQHGLNDTSYIKNQDGVAEVVPELLASKEQQKLADRLRSVEVKNKSKKEVCATSFFRTPYMRKFIPTFLDADQLLVLSRPASVRAFQS
jgi:hypothetical protein